VANPAQLLCQTRRSSLRIPLEPRRKDGDAPCDAVAELKIQPELIAMKPTVLTTLLLATLASPRLQPAALPTDSIWAWESLPRLERQIALRQPGELHGEKGKAGMATEGTGKGPATDLGQGWKVSPSVSIKAGTTFTLAEIKGPVASSKSG